MKDESVHCIVTSPPYFSLRKYAGIGDNQFGLEKTLEEYIEKSMLWLDECWRVMRRDATLFVNIGDSYNSANKGSDTWIENGKVKKAMTRNSTPELKPKDLCLVPFRFALAAQQRGWWIRSAIIWAKPNPMPESVTDRPTDAYEHIFLMTKAAKYWYDAEAVREKISQSYADDKRPHGVLRQRFYENSSYVKSGMVKAGDGPFPEGERATGRNLRNVWSFATEAFPSYLRDTGSHFACFPEELPRRCILAGCPEKVCAKCGAGWVRILEALETNHRREASHTPLHSATKVDSTGWTPTKGKTLGWKPSCACNAAHSFPTEAKETGTWTICEVCHIAEFVVRDENGKPIKGAPCCFRRGITLDVFCGSGTVVDVALRSGRIGIGVELSPDYIKLARKRTENSRKQGVLL